jgi:hypothetical protein
MPRTKLRMGEPHYWLAGFSKHTPHFVASFVEVGREVKDCFAQEHLMLRRDEHKMKGGLWSRDLMPTFDGRQRLARCGSK